MWNHYAHLECYFGIPAAGGVLHPLNLRLHPDEIAWIANHAQDRFLIVDDVLLPVLEKFLAKVKFERIFVVRHPGQSVQHGTPTTKTGSSAPAATSSCLPERKRRRQHVLHLRHHRQPKGVLYSHRSQVLHSMSQAMADSCAFSQHDTVLLASPMFHANGWGFSLPPRWSAPNMCSPVRIWTRKAFSN